MLNVTVLRAPLRPPTLPPFVTEKPSPPPSPGLSPRDVCEAELEAVADDLVLETSTDVLNAVAGLSSDHKRRKALKARQVGRRHVMGAKSRVTPAQAHRSMDLLPPRALTRKARKLRMTEFGWEVTRANGSGFRPTVATPMERRGSFTSINTWLRTHVDARSQAWDGLPMQYQVMGLPSSVTGA